MACGSIPLTVASVTEAVTEQTGGILTQSILTSETIFSTFNLIIFALLLIIIPIVNANMHPTGDKVITIDPKILDDQKERNFEVKTPAEKIENSKILSLIVALFGAVYLVNYFILNGFMLNLNIVNLIFLLLGVVFHGTPIKYVNAIYDGAKGASGIILQFPFYAGIMGMMVGVNPDTGVSLASVISDGFISISNTVTFPILSFLSAGIVNFFVPSGGGQWAVQAPIMLPAGEALNVPVNITVMSIAWGDAWSNMLQPFWALPVLGIAGLGARDIMGYCVVNLLVSGTIICSVFLVLGLM